MTREVERVCDQHPDRHDCPDCLIEYVPNLREYGLLIHDGGTSFAVIRHCPWCGAQLPTSLRSRWFEEIRARGLEPGDDAIPAEYLSSAWWQGC
jgi:hypothetical protein